MSYTPGPYTISRSGPNPSAPRMKWNKSGFKQPQPIDLKKQFDYFVSYAVGEMVRKPVGYPEWSLNSGGNWQNLWGSPWSPPSLAASGWSASVQIARERMMGKLYQQAELGINLAQASQAMDMILSRAVQLRRSVVALRKGRFREFLRILGIKRLPKHLRLLRTRAKDAGRLWLEYWFGWAPLVSDIGTAVGELQKDYTKNIFAFGTSVQKIRVKQRRKYWFERDIFYEIDVSSRTQATIDITNPNLFLGNRLGLINPAVVLWDLVPFSFLIDWFIPVDGFLRSFSEFAGLKVRSASTFTKCWWSGSETASSQYNVPASDLKFQTSGFAKRRTVGIPPWRYRNIVKLPSPTRAATAISLLLNELKRVPTISVLT